MSQFAVMVKRVRRIEAHPNADAIEFVVIDGYRSIVKKGQFAVDDLVAYLPEASVLPEWLLKRLNFWDAEKGQGTLSGKQGNRIKAIKLRGELSQGICYPLIKTDYPSVTEWRLERETESGVEQVLCHEFFDATDYLGVTKYEPPIPVSLSGEVFNAGQHLTLSFDVENIKSWPDVLREGEPVIFTEKLHGTFTGIAVLPERDSHPEAFGEGRNILLFSKRFGAKGLVLKNNENNEDNAYVRATRELINRLSDLYPHDVPLFFLGETFGPGVQDLTYGDTLGFRLFAMVEGYRGNQRYFSFDALEEYAKELGVETVPVLYRGPFTQDALREHTKGKTVMNKNHIREGIVITPIIEREHPSLGRVCLKSISEAYLTRKGGTEFN